MFSDDEKFTAPGADGSKVLSTVKYKDMLCLSRRMVDVRSYVYRLKWKKDSPKKLVELYASGECCDDDVIDENDPPTLLQYGPKEMVH